MVWNCQNADFGLRKKNYRVIFGTLSFRVAQAGRSVWYRVHDLHVHVPAPVPTEWQWPRAGFIDYTLATLQPSSRSRTCWPMLGLRRSHLALSLDTTSTQTLLQSAIPPCRERGSEWLNCTRTAVYLSPAGFEFSVWKLAAWRARNQVNIQRLRLMLFETWLPIK